MYNPQESRPISADKTYMVPGESLLALNSAIDGVITKLNWLSTRMADNMNSLASGETDGFIRYVARTSLVRDAVDQMADLVRRNGLWCACCHLDLVEVGGPCREGGSEAGE